MIRVVLDANIYISAVLKPASNTAKIFNLVTDDFIELIVSKSILSDRVVMNIFDMFDIVLIIFY